MNMYEAVMLGIAVAQLIIGSVQLLVAIVMLVREFR